MNVVAVPGRYTAGQLVRAYKFFQVNPTIKWRWDDYASSPSPVSSWFHWFRSKLEVKINRHTPLAICKWIATAVRIEDMVRRRCVIRRSDLNGLPVKIKHKLEHLVSE